MPSPSHIINVCTSILSSETLKPTMSGLFCLFLLFPKVAKEQESAESQCEIKLSVSTTLKADNSDCHQDRDLLKIGV